MNTNHIKPIKRLSLRDEVYHALKKSIITLELQPGQRLSDKELADQFGISRTPVREALKRLEDEGLIGSLPGSSTFVAPIQFEEAKHAFTVVAALHALAARLACPIMQEEDIAALEAINEELRLAIEQGDVIQAIEADTRFHHVFLDAAANPEILLAMERCVPKIHRLEVAQFNHVKGIGSVAQHRRILSALRNKEYEKTVRLVEENWLSLGELLTQPTEPR
ncbi:MULTISPECIES: GntR family transcriptional regulator [Paenibacillus]|uniref:GntR family transcriptional regulator n=1 Tax=Paenibacillus campinasensis TaxID=66347 RepID=A0A268EVK5_9BACL|nr:MULTISPECIES: GntR family transcriptional regulator [Paenibacillus]PAD77131.1 GntR family transcriptional regulator [Paenibacillus campinasensis]PAK48583.1 GntR family transcriptional regulator [Paenibacillus sp. 7541]